MEILPTNFSIQIILEPTSKNDIEFQLRRTCSWPCLMPGIEECRLHLGEGRRQPSTCGVTSCLRISCDGNIA